MKAPKQNPRRAGQRKPRPPKIIERKRVVKGEEKHLIYTPYFKRIVRENPKAIELFLEARKSKKSAIRRGNIEVTYLPFLSPNGKFWRVNIGKKSFFVKEQPVTKPLSPEEGWVGRSHWGTTQLLALRKVQRVLPPNTEVAKYHLGWRGKSSSFFVSDFYEHGILQTKGQLPESLQKEFLEVKRRADATLGIFDVHEKHFFYDSRRGKIILFDISDSSA